MHIYHLEDDEYIGHTESLAFPWLPAERITRVVEEFSTLGAPDALENFEEWNSCASAGPSERQSNHQRCRRLRSAAQHDEATA